MKNNKIDNKMKQITCMDVYKMMSINQIIEFYRAYNTKVLMSESVLENTAIPEIEQFIKNTKARIKYVDCANTIPRYIKQDDYIEMTKIQHFNTSDAYYLAFCEELILWTTGNKNRLKLDLRAGYKGERGDGMQILVSQLGAIVLFSYFRVKSKSILTNLTPHVPDSLKFSKFVKMEIPNAMDLALKAANYLLDLNNSY